MAELLPCPFCGGKACVDKHSFYNEQTKGFTDHSYGVFCENCNAQTAQFYLTEKQAKGAWNTRTPKEKTIKTSRWLIEGMTEEQIQKAKAEAIVQAKKELARVKKERGGEK